MSRILLSGRIYSWAPATSRMPLEIMRLRSAESSSISRARASAPEGDPHLLRPVACHGQLVSVPGTPFPPPIQAVPPGGRNQTRNEIPRRREPHFRPGSGAGFATTASWWKGLGNLGTRLACRGPAGGTGHRFAWPVLLRRSATNRQTTKSDRLSHQARRRINELRVGFRRGDPGTG